MMIPLIPWSKIEFVIFSLGGRDYKPLKSQTDIDKAVSFLKSISFIDENKQLTEVGKNYYYNSLVLNDKNTAYEFLSGKLIELKSVQLICQILWGRLNIKKENIANLLYIEGIISSKENINIGPFIGLLSKCKIISYNKKNGYIQILFNPRSEKQVNTSFLSPDTPYTNIRSFRNILEKCDGFIWWFDKQFSLKGFEPLSDIADGTKINEIKMLMGKTSNVNEKMKNEFNRFKKEMEIRGIKIECRVIIDKTLFHDIHDRWIISENVTYNLPPINSIYKGQYSEIKITEQIPPFNNWWEKGLDIVEEWGKISI